MCIGHADLVAVLVGYHFCQRAHLIGDRVEGNENDCEPKWISSHYVSLERGKLFRARPLEHWSIFSFHPANIMLCRAILSSSCELTALCHFLAVRWKIYIHIGLLTWVGAKQTGIWLAGKVPPSILRTREADENGRIIFGLLYSLCLRTYALF